MSRQWTEEEVRNKLLEHIWAIINYWHGDYDHKIALKPCREKLEGLAFSILATLDGCSPELPGFIVAPTPHPDDRGYHKMRGENWWPENPYGAICDLGGTLHDSFYAAKWERGDECSNTQNDS